jgi:hypothetical protein
VKVGVLLNCVADQAGGPATAHSHDQRTQEVKKADSAKAAPTCRLKPRGSSRGRDHRSLASPAAGGLAAQPLPHRPGEAERAFALAERLGSVNAAAAELGTTWPSLPKAFTHHRLGMSARNPEAVR